MIEPKHPKLSVVRQCELLELPRATYYRQPKPESDENLELMRVIDETYLAHPFYGSRQMRDHLRLQGYRVNRKRVQRLMRLLELEAIYRKPNTSAPHPEHRVYEVDPERETGGTGWLVMDRTGKVNTWDGV